MIFAGTVSASAKEGEPRSCNTTLGGQVICGDLVIGITLEQYEAGLKQRAEAIRAEEAEKRIQLQKLVDLTERATSAEKDSLRSQIAAVAAEKRALGVRRLHACHAGFRQCDDRVSVGTGSGAGIG
jgi:hypothetical protein